MIHKTDKDVDTKTEKQEKEEVKQKNLANGRASVVSGLTDGKTLFMEIDLFDGEHNHRFFPTFAADTKAEEITEYMKHVVENAPKVSPEILALIQTGIYYDTQMAVWMIKPATGPAVPEKDKDGKVKK